MGDIYRPHLQEESRTGSDQATSAAADTAAPPDISQYKIETTASLAAILTAVERAQSVAAAWPANKEAANFLTMCALILAKAADEQLVRKYVTSYNRALENIKASKPAAQSQASEVMPTVPDSRPATSREIKPGRNAPEARPELPPALKEYERIITIARLATQLAHGLQNEPAHLKWAYDLSGSLNDLSDTPNIAQKAQEAEKYFRPGWLRDLIHEGYNRHDLRAVTEALMKEAEIVRYQPTVGDEYEPDDRFDYEIVGLGSKMRIKKVVIPVYMHTPTNTRLGEKGKIIIEMTN